ISVYKMTTIQALDVSSEYQEWLSEQPVTSTMLVFFVTESVLNGGWVFDDAADRAWHAEIEASLPSRLLAVLLTRFAAVDRDVCIGPRSQAGIPQVPGKLPLHRQRGRQLHL
ncbi:hypothetical protein FRC09_017201, partial [Ceratobasidium sp. 395]